jgi:hypothetical protein
MATDKIDTLMGYPVVLTLSTEVGPITVADALRLETDPVTRAYVDLDAVLNALRRASAV